MKKKIVDIIYTIVVFIGVVCCAYFFANIPTRPLIDLISSKVSYTEILDGYDLNFVGKMGADDVPVLTSKDVAEVGVRDSCDFVVETKNIVPLEYYELRSSDWSQITRRNSRGRARGVTNIARKTEKPLFIYDFLYAGYYLVELDDGSYITAFMNQDYANSKILPIAYLDMFDKNLQGDIVPLIEKNTDIKPENINLDRILIMQVDERDVVFDFLDLGIRIIATLILAVFLLLILAKITKKLKLD